MVKKSKTHSALFQKKPWEDNLNNIWLASTITVHRNIDKFLFPSKLEKDKRAQIISILSKELLKSQHLQRPFLIKAEEIGPVEKEYLVEHFLSSRGFQQAHSGEAFILDETGAFLTTLNIGNHVNFELIDCSGELETAWNHMVKIESELGKAVNYTYNSKFGFLTSDPTICGTGFLLTVFLQPSALIHTGKMQQIMPKIRQEGIVITGLQGNPNEIIGDIYAIRNNFTLGLTEENIISQIRLFTTKLMVEERNERTHLRKNIDADLMDKVSRAFGVLIHSYKIEPVESLNAISLIKLGADLGWLDGVSPKELNQLFFECRRAHLLAKFDEEIPLDEISHKRAEFIHQVLKKAKLKI